MSDFLEYSIMDTYQRVLELKLFICTSQNYLSLKLHMHYTFIYSQVDIILYM